MGAPRQAGLACKELAGRMRNDGFSSTSVNADEVNLIHVQTVHSGIHRTKQTVVEIVLPVEN